MLFQPAQLSTHVRPGLTHCPDCPPSHSTSMASRPELSHLEHSPWPGQAEPSRQNSRFILRFSPGRMQTAIPLAHLGGLRVP